MFIFRNWQRSFVVGVFFAPMFLGLGGAANAEDGSGEKSVAEKIQRLVSVSLAMIDNDDFDKTPALFHYPERYTEGELNRDRCMISKSMRIMTDVFGKPSELKPQEHVGQIKHYSIHIRAGDAKYWQKKDARASTSFFADFANIGPGVVNFQFEGVEKGRPVLRSLAFGLETSSQDAKERLTKLGKQFAGRVRQAKPECDALVEFK